MAHTTYALLVGIDAYPHPVPPLRGCVNDIRRVETMLQARCRESGTTFAPLVLTDRAATRQALIDAWRSHLGQAGQGDTALFYYSGHGSQAPSPPEFWKFEPDRLDETLVCWDSRLPQPKADPSRRHWDLADKELAQLIADVAKTGAHVTVILDCCHSGSGTRNIDDPAVRVRRVPTDQRIRPISDFIVTPAEAEALVAPAGIRALQSDSGWGTLPEGRHILLSACRAEEEAKELHLGGEQRGAFSYYLLDTLAQATDQLSYQDLFKRVSALVRARVSLQAPQLEATNPADLTQPFLGGAIQKRTAHYTVSRDKELGWVMDGGSVHGIPAPDGGETTLLALFPFGATASSLQDLSSAVGTASVTSVLATQAKLDITLRDGSSPSPEMVYKAVVTALPLPPLNVALTGDDTALELLRDALATANRGAPSLLLRESSREQATLVVDATAGRYQISRVGDAYPLGVETEGFNDLGAGLAIHRLEHIARWFKIVELTNANTQLTEDAVTLSIVRGGKDDPDDDLIDTTAAVYLPYELRNGRWRQPAIRVKLKNNSEKRLFCMLFDATESYAVSPLLRGPGVWLDGGQEAWVAGGDAIYPEVPRQLWQQGVTEYRDTLKLIVTTDESDANLLSLDELPTVVMAPKSVPIAHMNTLNRLMARVSSRALRFFPEDDEPIADWYTVTVPLTTVRPQEAVEIAPPGSESTLTTGVALLGHSLLKAVARLTTMPFAGRDAGNLLSPPLLRDQPELFTPLELSNSRSGVPGLSVLELSQVNDHTVVTPADPLVVQLSLQLEPGEAVVPVGFDGEFFLPLGYATQTDQGVTVTLDRLPAPTAAGTRDLKGTIKILFQKLVAQPLGWEYTYPQLAVGEIDNRGKVQYTKELAAVQEQVAAVEKIVLYIHGIIGDTRKMSGSARTDWQSWDDAPEPIPAVVDQYDLLLTFDYENINTPIEENALLLKQRLAEVGLGPNHGKTVHIIAHSMGGLISRWFIEREGGNKVVQKLIMLGTPNGGTPWPTVQDYANIALGVALNGLSEFSWSAGAITAFIGALEEVDVTLDQMNPDSKLLMVLNTSEDPGIPYVMIAGDTGLIPTALVVDATTGSSLMSRLVDRLSPKRLLHAATAPAFFGQPNDIAASVASVFGVPANRQQEQVRIEGASDHVSYFQTADVLRKLGLHIG